MLIAVRMMNLAPAFRPAVVGIAALFTLIGCSGTVTVTDQFPDPLVEPLPLRVGLFMSPEFRGYVHEDDDVGVKFELGSKQSALYRTVFDSLFLQAIEVSGHGGDADLDLVIEPVLEEYAFLSPAETATNFYAVSLKYQMRLYSGDGELIGYWPFVAYGKNRTQMINKFESLGDATSLALRDAAAALVTQFRDVLVSRQWDQLEGRS